MTIKHSVPFADIATFRNVCKTMLWFLDDGARVDCTMMSFISLIGVIWWSGGALGGAARLQAFFQPS